MSTTLTKNILLSQPKAGQGGESHTVTLPYVTMIDETHAIIKVEIPGVDPAEVVVTCEGGQLKVTCEKGEATVNLDPTVDTSKVEAEVLWGVLTLKVPLPKAPVTRSISVKTLEAPLKKASAKQKHEEVKEEFTEEE
jgi:HSP20 family molecular chaperone IbpA